VKGLVEDILVKFKYVVQRRDLNTPSCENQLKNCSNTIAILLTYGKCLKILHFFDSEIDIKVLYVGPEVIPLKDFLLNAT